MGAALRPFFSPPCPSTLHSPPSPRGSAVSQPSRSFLGTCWCIPDLPSSGILCSAVSGCLNDQNFPSPERPGVFASSPLCDYNGSCVLAFRDDGDNRASPRFVGISHFSGRPVHSFSREFSGSSTHAPIFRSISVHLGISRVDARPVKSSLDLTSDLSRNMLAISLLRTVTRSSTGELSRVPFRRHKADSRGESLSRMRETRRG
jgi:hypothetical protein